MSTASPAARPAPHHVPAFDAAAFEAFLAARGEPSWLADRRRAAFEAFRAAAWPTLRDEEWRRTDIRAFKLADFGPLESREPSVSEVRALSSAWDTLSGHYAAGIMQVNGQLARRSDTASLPDGVVFTDLATAVRDHPEILRESLLTKAVNPAADVFSALHAAFWTGGTLLYVPRGVAVDAPLFHLIGLGADEGGNADLSHTLVILEEGASASLVQESASGPGGNAAGLHVGAVELIVGPGAHLRFVNIQNWDAKTWHFSRERAVVGRDATLQWTVGGLGARLAKVNQEVALADQGARAQVNGVMFTTGRQNLTYLTRQDHQAPHTTSDLLYKAGLKDESRVVWKGMIRVEPGAQKTDAYQKNDNLILDESARADSIPGLEIEANDVRCTHGATAGPVDPDMVFYLTSRGISRETATRLIVEGFFANVYDRITLAPVRETLEKVVAAKLGTGPDGARPGPRSDVSISC